jgi:hypothetical protein
MRSDKLIALGASSAIFLCMALSCTTTVTRIKNPVFNSRINDLQINLAHLVIFEHLNLSGKEILSNGSTSSELEISVINGRNIPNEPDKLKALGKAIGSEIKSVLADKFEYGKYDVLFVTQEITDGRVTRSWKGLIFKSKEL